MQTEKRSEKEDKRLIEADDLSKRALADADHEQHTLAARKEKRLAEQNRKEGIPSSITEQFFGGKRAGIYDGERQIIPEDSKAKLTEPERISENQSLRGGFETHKNVAEKHEDGSVLLRVNEPHKRNAVQESAKIESLPIFQSTPEEIGRLDDESIISTLSEITEPISRSLQSFVDALPEGVEQLKNSLGLTEQGYLQVADREPNGDMSTLPQGVKNVSDVADVLAGSLKGFVRTVDEQARVLSLEGLSATAVELQAGIPFAVTNALKFYTDPSGRLGDDVARAEQIYHQLVKWAVSRSQESFSARGEDAGTKAPEVFLSIFFRGAKAVSYQEIQKLGGLDELEQLTESELRALGIEKKIESIQHKDLAFRGDHDCTSRENTLGRPKSFINDAGDLCPTSVDGLVNGKTVTIAQHLNGGWFKSAKANSPFTSFSFDGEHIAKFGNQRVILDLKGLREAVSRGELEGVEIIDHQDVLRHIHESKMPDMPKSKIYNSAVRDKEIIVKGIIPKSFIKVIEQ